VGTRSLTFVYDDDNKPIINMYRQYDGYFSGHGAELAKFLQPFQIIKGIGGGQNKLGKFANGMGCLAAQLVAHFKNDVGGFYLYPVSAKDCGQDYEYHVYESRVIVKNLVFFKNQVPFLPNLSTYHLQTIFDGSWKDFKEFVLSTINEEIG
jgi:hypothetical protein